MRRAPTTAIAISFVTLVAAATARGQQPPPGTPATAPSDGPRPAYSIRATTAHVDIDGKLDEAPWQGAPTFTLEHETYPGDNSKPPAVTEMWITYDASNLYVAARAHDPEPNKIRARLRDRDNVYQDDSVGVALDTFNDERRAFEFFVNPLGVQLDMFMNDFTGTEDASWDTLWASAGRLTEVGYEVEMAIPFSSLRFPRASGPQTWGIDAARIWPRDEKRRFGLVPLPRGRTCYLCYEAKLTSIEGVTPGRNLEADPTVTGHGTDSRASQDADYERDSKVEPGITGRWGITPGVTLNAAIQPDFSQVEADAAQLSVNTQFSLFYPEKRPFFLEGADLFDLKLQPVYTRTIADPDWGIKLSGKQGSNAFGLIGARDAITNLVIPAREFSSITSIDQENDAAIVRYRRDLGSGGSGIGGIFTDRRGTDYRNTLLGGDYLIRRGADSLRIEALGSSSRYPLSVQQQFAQEEGDFDGHSMRVAYLHSERYWLAHAMYFDVSDGFRSDLGFLPQVGYRKLYANAEGYRYHDDGQHFWSRVTTGFETTWHYDYDGNPLQEQVAPYIFLSGRRQTDINVYLGTGPSWYQQQRFDRYFVGWTASTQLTSTFFASLDGRVGQEIDYANVRQGRIVRLIPGLRYEPGRHLRLELKHFDEALRSGGGRVYHVGLSELRSTYQINVRTFVRLITQYQDLRQDPALFVPAAGPIEPEVQSLFDQLLFAYKLNPQTVLFVGYADDLSSDSSTGGRLERTDRTVFMKVGYAFVW